MKSIWFDCGCGISWIMGTNKVHSCRICEKHVMKLLGIRSKSKLADTVMELAGKTKKGRRT